MKLYKTTYFKQHILHDGTVATGIKFDGSATAASKTRSALKAADKDSKPATIAVEVFAKKDGLLQFLNGLIG
jgi:hypothetical protein